MRILLVEDDEMIAKGLDHALSGAGFAVDRVCTAEDCLVAIRTQSYGLMLLDLGLPDAAGLDVLRDLRKGKSHLPVIIVTARDDVDSRVAGLDAGADDYLTKPFDFAELGARIRAVIRRHQGQSAAVLTAGEITLDLARHEVRYRGQSLVLPAREFALMRALMERPGTILSRRQLEERLYDWGSEVESNAVDVLIHYVRRKFDKDIIRNVRGVGWAVLDPRH